MSRPGKKGAAEASAMLEKAQRQADIILKKANSAAQTNRSREMLAEKVSMINEVIGQASEKIKALPDEEYSDALLALAVRFAQSGNGVMRLSCEDSARLSAGFEEELNKRISGKEASLRLETAEQETGGFKLIYGDVEQNCTFDALIDSMRDELKDKINRELFL